MQTVAPPARPRTGSLSLAALASIGAGAVHAVAAGAHSEHQQAMWAFVVLAAAQIAWGVFAMRRSDRRVAAAGAALAGLAVAGWATAKISGIGLVGGLEAAEPVQTADLLAAGLAFVVFGACVMRLLDVAPIQPLAPVSALVVVALVLPGMAYAGIHDHDDGHADGEEHADGGGHGHDDDEISLARVTGADDSDDHASVVPPAPYDPDLPLNLSGVEGVTKKQQARAEQLIAVTLHHLPRWADTAQAEADGYHSIGDAATGYEHYVNRELINDDKILDPEHPESLVYQVVDGEKTLVAAMYMLTDDDTLDDVPDVGGKLTQWHIHNDLCFTPDPVAPKVGGLRNAEGECNPPLVKGSEAPMLHVWIVPHECGPFAALEGIAGGQIPEGEERWCDHAHGA
jgi:hypothetical protein